MNKYLLHPSYTYKFSEETITQPMKDLSTEIGYIIHSVRF